MPASITNLTAETFKPAIASGALLVNFWAPWCGPCKTIAPALEKTADELAGKIKVAKLDVNDPDNQAVAAACHVRAVPTFILFKDGIEITRFSGLNGITEPKAFMAKIQPFL